MTRSESDALAHGLRAKWQEDAKQMKNLNWRGEPEVDRRILALLDALEEAECRVDDHYDAARDRLRERDEALEQVRLMRGQRERIARAIEDQHPDAAVASPVSFRSALDRAAHIARTTEA